MQYSVKGKYLRGGEIIFDSFKEMNQAKNYIKDKLLADTTLNVKVIYRLYDYDEMIHEYDPDQNSTQAFIKNQKNDKQDAQQHSTNTNQRPNPFSITLKPPGALDKKRSIDEKTK
jgi:hypothetical protein